MSDLINGRELLKKLHNELCDDIACNDCTMCTEDGGCRVEEWIDKFPDAKTKQVKYYDDEEKVWKIGEVIANTLHDITDSYKGSEYNGNIKD